MIQFYLLSVLYLVLASGLLLVDKYGSTVFFLINLKTFYNSKKLIQIICLSVGAVILLGVVFFPVNPGPMVLGDLLPAINLAIVIFLKDDVLAQLKSYIYSVKSCIMKDDSTELTIQIDMKSDDGIAEKVRAVSGVKDVTMIRYNGEYHG